MPKNEFADPAGGAYSTPPDSLAGNGVGPREGGGKRRRGEGRRGDGREGMGRGRAIPPSENPGYGFVWTVTYNIRFYKARKLDTSNKI